MNFQGIIVIFMPPSITLSFYRQQKDVSMVADLCHFVFSLFRGDITKAP